MIPKLIDPTNIQLRTDNPYARGTIIDFEDGTYELVREPLQIRKSPRDRYYTTIADQELGGIAFEAYGNSKYWWIIAEANNIDLPFELEAGTTLLIPDIEQLKIGQLG